MAELYSVGIDEIIDNKTCILNIKVIHPDAVDIYPTEGFALMMLRLYQKLQIEHL